MAHAAPPRSVTPAYRRVSPAQVDGSPCLRLMLVLRTRGCEYAQRTGGCSVCGFLAHADPALDDGAILAQLDAALDQGGLEGVAELDLLTLGSFLNDREVSPSLRGALLDRVAQLPALRRVSFESRVEHITREKLGEARARLGDRIVELGIGLESADDRVRNELIRKDLSRAAFLEAIDTVARAGLRLLVYLLIKPPGLDEAAAIRDAVASARFVFREAAARGVRARVAFEPVFVCEDTELEALYSAASYRLVNLWSVVEVISQVHGEGEVFVGLSDEGLARGRRPVSCEACSEVLTDAIEAYNSSQSLEALSGVSCDCRGRYLEELAGSAR